MTRVVPEKESAAYDVNAVYLARLMAASRRAMTDHASADSKQVVIMFRDVCLICFQVLWCVETLASWSS